MTESEGPGRDPVLMIENLGEAADINRLRLFAVACCRRLWDVLDSDCKQAVEIAERHAHGLAKIEELRIAALSLLTKQVNAIKRSAVDAVRAALYDPLIADCYLKGDAWPAQTQFFPYAASALQCPFAFAKYASIYTAYTKAELAASNDPKADRMEVVYEEYEVQCRLLDDILDNPTVP